MKATPTNWKIQAPSVTLFAFHLRNDITTNSQQVKDNAEQIWRQCSALGWDLKILPLQYLSSSLRSYTYNQENRQYCYDPANEDKEATEAEQPYLDDWLELVRLEPQANQARQLRFYSDDEDARLQIMGEIYPLRIHDTYAVDLTLRYRETVEFADLRSLNSSEEIKGSIGQSLLLFCQPVNVPESNYQEFANQCVAALLPKNKKVLKPLGNGKIFGSPIFEYESDSHIIVWLNCHQETVQRIGKREAYHALLNLLCCRSKILYAYHQSRLCDRAAQEIYAELEEDINTLATPQSKTLEEMKQWLKETPLSVLKYSKMLREIEDHQTAIATNAQNYRSRLEQIRQLSLADDNLELLENFLDRRSKQFQEQIEVDRRYLVPSQQLFQQMIDTIRGIVEIESQEHQLKEEQKQQQRDRKIETWVAAVGFGLAISSVTSAVNPNIISHSRPDGTKPLGLSFLDVLIHLSFGLIPVFIVLLVRYPIRRLIQKRSK